MKHLHRMINALQPQAEETSGIEALAQISRLELTEGYAIPPKIQVQPRSRSNKRRLPNHQAE